MTIVNETFHFRSRDGGKRELVVPSFVWDEERFTASELRGRYDTWLEWELTQAGENVDSYDVYALALELRREVRAARPDWIAKHEHLKLSAELADRYKIPVGESALAFRNRAVEEREWFIPGLIARGGVLLMGGREKLSGKSMLLMNLIGAMERAEETLFGPTPHPVKTLLLTEEPEFSIREKLELFNLRDSWIVEDHEWALDKFAGRYASEKWETKLSLLEALARDWGAEHVVIDPLARTAAVEDEAGRELGLRMEAVGRMAYRSGLAVTVVHHANKKSDAAREDKMRGSTSLTAAPDQIVYVQRHEAEAAHAKYPTQRELLSYGRLLETNWEKTIEYQDGKYVEVDVKAEVEALKEAKRAEGRASERIRRMIAFRRVASQNDGIVTKNLLAEAVEKTPATAGNWLKALEAEGIIQQLNGDGNANYYREVEK